MMTNKQLRYVGTQESNSLYHHGQLRPVIGTHNIQVLRANRKHPEWADGYGWTFNHSPMITYWKNKFYLQYISTPNGENIPPCHALLCESVDGITWGSPKVIFPPYLISKWPEDVETLSVQNSYAMMHQRMSFYHAPNGKLLCTCFYGVTPTPCTMPNNGKGIGRIVREIKPDGSFGDIFFIKYNQHVGWNESNTNFPYYLESEDRNFVFACDALLTDPLINLQWWEEEQDPNTIYPLSGIKAPSFYHIDSDIMVAVGKWSKYSFSVDNGVTWNKPINSKNIKTTGGKVWGQKSSSGFYNLFLNPNTHDHYRWPLSVLVGKDGWNFSSHYLINGEVPMRRYFGLHKYYGLNYVVGIPETHNQPPGNDIWITYSMNKEDIWVSKIPDPYRVTEISHLNEIFNRYNNHLKDWNIYKPLWSSWRVVDLPYKYKQSLEIKSCEPSDYIKLERVFPMSKKVNIKLSAMARQCTHGHLDVEIVDETGNAASHITFKSDGYLYFSSNGGEIPLFKYKPNIWYEFNLSLNFYNRIGSLKIKNGIEVLERLFNLNYDICSVERIVFRTGMKRNFPNINTKINYPDLNNVEEPITSSLYYINYVNTSTVE
ncbi:hypothetical protein [Cytobacillus pseudoceanisediminis]|uniref:hypothetical protein n=1 Tax=Cytobacillus pseudoceanisediminis TaxID=3051614 RepID=UPI003C30329B